MFSPVPWQVLGRSGQSNYDIIFMRTSGNGFHIHLAEVCSNLWPSFIPMKGWST